MAENIETNEISLKSTKKIISCNNYVLKVPNFFTFDTPFDTNSPSFEFDNATWCFRFYSSTKLHSSTKQFTVVIMRLNTKKLEHEFFYRISLLDANGLKYDDDKQTKSGDCYYKEYHQKNILKCFDNASLTPASCSNLTLVIDLFKLDSIQVIGNQLIQILENSPHNVAAKADGNELKLFNKMLSNDEYTLKVPNFFTLPECERKGFEIRSPSFEFANATWCFRFFRVAKTEKHFNKKFAVNLTHLNHAKPFRIIFVKYALHNDDKLYDLGMCMYDDKEDDKNNQITFVDFHSSDENTSDFLTFTVQLMWDGELEEDATPIIRNRDFDLLSQDYKKMFLDGRNSDLILKVSEREFRVHQSVLMARSPVFEAMLSHDMIEKNNGIVDVPDIDPEVMEQFLIFLYRGKAERFNQDNVLGLYYVADKYDVTILKEQCSKLLKKTLSPSIICGVIQLALKHNDTNLLECATNCFVRHANDIIPTEEWKAFMKSNTDAAVELIMKAMKK